MAKHFAANILSILVVTLLIAGAGVLWGKQEYSDPGPLTQSVCFKVESGSNMQKVSKNLAQIDAISSDFVFGTGAKYEGKSDRLKAGSFIIPANSSMADIVEIVTRDGASTCGSGVSLVAGISAVRMRVRGLNAETGTLEELARFDPTEAEVAFPAAYSDAESDSDTRYTVNLIEGATNWQLQQALLAAPFLEGDIEDMPQEGALAPNSYEVAKGDTRQSVIETMKAAQDAILEEAWLVRDPETPLESRNDALILASIVEKETGLAEERPLVASVFVNRLNKGIRLQTDPTVIYGITKGEGSLGRGLRRSELDRATPFNTYQIDGLPPTPIANPSKAAIEAVLNPAESEFIFFVADGTGGHAFAKTLDEHNRNVAVWRKIEAERAEEANSSQNN
jgi:UPF0755 protein